MKLTFNRKELYSASLMLLIGIGTTAGSLNYDIRTLARMGPGYFPLMLGVLLIIVSLMMLVSPSDDGENADEKTKEQPQYRGWCFVILGVVLFILLGRYGGLVPATFVLVVVSALGDSSNSLKTAVLLGLVITLMAVGIFHYGLQMQFPLFTWG